MQAAFRLIWKRIQARDQEKLREYLRLFLGCFRDPPTVPGIPYLNYRVPTHEFWIKEQLEKASFAAIVVS